ncbi:hypothetical protein FRC09_018502 [Ceratobasidium sp. 395]|nr:hypothetical protein FRC09_018502 [Ceratobasidium sp. 395]
MSRPIPAHALIIAVNGASLGAPELDAAKLRSALASLGITSIDMLVGRAATRQNIIQSLNNIADNPRIPQDSPIIVYYAGHGTQQPINIPGAGPRKVECIVPVDSLGRPPAPPIPDITISTLVGRIARKKSKYITLFFDCCHAGSGSRDDEVEEAADFTVEVDPDELAELDKELWLEALENPIPNEESSSRDVSSHPQSFRFPGITSHVLIASCHETQKSQEYTVRGAPPQGLFTTALLEALEECVEDKILLTVTHAALFERIKAIMQHIQRDNQRVLPNPQVPQCEGYSKSRSIFSTPALPHGSHAIAPLVGDPNHGTCLLPLGSLAGVQPQTTFEIYDYPNGKLKMMGRFKVANLSDSQTMLNIGRLQTLPEAYAVMCTPPVALPVEMVGDFPTLYNEKSFQGDLVGRLGSHEPLNHFVAPVGSGHRSKVRASYSRSQGSVELRNTYGGVLHIRKPLRASDALSKAVMFFHHLDQPNLSPLHNSGMFDIRIHELVPAKSSDWSAIDRTEVLVPRRDRAPIAMQPTPGGCTVPGSDSSFGLQIINRGAYPFFVHVFYFDPNDYSITPIYLPPGPNVAPLPARGELTVGYGDAGASPLSFTVDDRTEKDSGLIKVYYSTSPSDMSFIQQDGFEERRDSRPGAAAHIPSPYPFGSITYPVTVTNPRRH